MVVLVWLWIKNDSSGRAYNSQDEMCQQMALSYLKTMRKVEPEMDEDTWAMAVDVETDLFNLCQLELQAEALGKYEAQALKKYYQGSLRAKLLECLPKSDMASRQRCEELLQEIESYEECVEAGFEVIDTEPEKCRTIDDREFVKQLN